jgi:hypothetical protein
VKTYCHLQFIIAYNAYDKACAAQFCSLANGTHLLAHTLNRRSDRLINKGQKHQKPFSHIFGSDLSGRHIHAVI